MKSSSTLNLSTKFHSEWPKAIIGWLSGFILLLIAEPVWAQTSVFQFDTPGTQNWVIPTGVSRMQIEAWGGGANGLEGRAGNGGDYVRSNIIYFSDAPLVSTLSISVGNAGQSSGVTFIGQDLYYIALGGKNDGTPQQQFGFTDRVYYAGGRGGTSCYEIFGGLMGGAGGGSAFTYASGNPGSNGICYSSQAQGGSGSGRGGNGGIDYMTAQSGQVPGGGGGGGYSPGFGARGRVKISVWCDGLSPGTIGNAHTIIFPQERTPDFITSISGYSGVWGQLSYDWQKSPDGISNWTSTGQTAAQFSIPEMNQDTWFRRAVTGCGNTEYSNVLKIKVLAPNGTISGKVISTGNVGVQGIDIRIRKLVDLPGSPKEYEYSTITGTDGTYSVPVYFGDKTETSGGLSISTPFFIVASKQGHIFSQDTLKRTITDVQFNISGVDFTDLTAYSITGKVFQTCNGCLDNNDNPATITSNLDEVSLYRSGTFVMKSKFLNPPGEYGRWATTVVNQGTYSLRPSMVGRKFVPEDTTVNVIGNVSNINFRDTTTRLITGRIGDGCKVQIGEAILEFQDVLRDVNGQFRPSEFRKRVTTQNGEYAIRLPARKYKVTVVSFTPAGFLLAGGPVSEPDFKAFFNTNKDSSNVKSAQPFDSLLADISSSNKILNLWYQRPPVIVLENLSLQTCTVNNQLTTLDFVAFTQSVPKPYAVKVFQGNQSANCPAKGDSVIVNTNIQNDDQNERRALAVKNGIARDTLTGGIPNILPALGFVKTFSVSYTDGYGRQATGLNPKVVVLGVKADNASSFATTSPQIPIMVLHDPPGDQSSSFWQTDQTIERAMSWSVSTGNSTEGWMDVKLGTKFEAGFGVTTETEIWGSINSSINVSSRTNNANEAIISTTTSQTISTSSDEDVTGDRGDLFIGSAINLLYTRAFEVKLNDQCELEAPKKLMIAQNGFGTQYVYTDAAIRENVIPTLKSFANNPGNSEEEKNRYLDQVRVWEQVLANNEANKRKSAFDKNISFFGSSGPITNSTTTTSTSRSTIEFDMEIDAGIAAELGFNIAGSGVSGGVNVHFRTETGRSSSLTNTQSTTIGYILDDNDALDNFSVNVRKDPVYNTPVFQTVAGQSSCPAEDFTLARDEPQLIAPQPEVSVPANQDAVFELLLGNLSVDVNPRTYSLSFDQASNPFGATISVGGIPMGATSIPYSIGQMDAIPVTVNVKRNQANNAFTYEGLRFYLSDACTGDISKTATLTARFQATCDPLTLVSPEENWLVNTASNNVLSVTFKDYNLSAVQSVALEYMPVNSSNWRLGFTRTAAQLTNSPNGTQVNWNVATLADGQYYIRMRMTCSGGLIYTQRVKGTIDRNGPLVFGVPQPSDYRYSVGDEISFSYNENINTQNLNQQLVSLERMANQTFIPISVTGFANKLVVVSQTDLMAYSGEWLRLVVKDVEDVYGNKKTNPDTLIFDVGNFVPATGNRALQVVANPATKAEGSASPILITFSLPQAPANDVQVNFLVGGTALFNDDYTVGFSRSNALNTFDGSKGTAIIPKNQLNVSLRIFPKTDGLQEPDENVLITLAEGGDYFIGASYRAEGIILDNSLAAPTITGQSQICPGTTTVLTASHPQLGNAGYSLLWSNGATTPTITVSQAGVYTVKIMQTGTGIEGVSTPFTVTTFTMPNTNAGPDITITQGSGNFPLGGSPSGGTWSGPGVSGSSFNTNQPSGSYSLLYCFTSEQGCTKCDTAVITLSSGTPGLVATPQFSLGTGTYGGPITVAISTATPGASIYYTTSGNTPVIGTSFTKLYTGPVTFNQTGTLKAMAVLNGLANSSVASAYYTITAPTIVATPVISVPTGNYPTAQWVSLSTTTAGAEIYYTTSGNLPVIGTSFTRLYTSPFQISATTTVRAMAIKSGMTNSSVAVSFITIAAAQQLVAATPEIFPASGTYAGSQTISLTCSTPGVQIWYTTNGNVPRLDVPNSFTMLYSGPFVVSKSTTVRAIAVKTDVAQSGTAAAFYTIGVARQAVDLEETSENKRDHFIYPNPSSNGIFKIDLADPESETRFEVTSMEGRSLEKGEWMPVYTKHLDLSRYPAGLYLLKLIQKDKILTHRLIRQ